MKFPYRPTDDFEGTTNNFEFLETSGIFWGSGAPTFTPDSNRVSFYFRKDTPGTVNQRIYIYNGSAWVGIV